MASSLFWRRTPWPTRWAAGTTYRSRWPEGSFRFCIDGQELFNVRDISHDRGSIGFYSWNNTGAEFDDLAVIPRTTLGCTYSFQPKSVDVSSQAATGAVNLVTQDDCLGH